MVGHPVESAMVLPAFVIAAALLASTSPSGQTAAAAPQTSSATSNADAYFFFLQGHQLEGTGDVAGAIDAYKKAIAAMPTSGEIRAELSGVYARAGRANEAVTAALDALKVDPKNYEAHRILGLVQAALADNTSEQARQTNLQNEAISHLEQALAGGSHDLSAELAL